MIHATVIYILAHIIIQTTRQNTIVYTSATVVACNINEPLTVRGRQRLAV